VTADDAGPTQVMELPPKEREVLAALAVVGRASLSTEELGELVEVQDVGPLVDDLRRRGLVEEDEQRRYSVLRQVGEELRETDAALAKGERLLRYMTTLAKGGRLTPERLVEDAEAILGLSEWAAETRRWATLLELVKTLQACFGIAERAQQWLTLLERGREAARALGDPESEVWVLQRMATAAASSGDTAAAKDYLREADRLERERMTVRRRTREPEEATTATGPSAPTDRGMPRTAWWIAGLVVVAAAGLGAGWAIGGSGENIGQTTATVPVTVTGSGQTLTTQETVTLPATTVLTTTTALSTTTVTTTVTTGGGVG
jgi:hypothetical protein